jgi:hypothetical protein
MSEFSMETKERNFKIVQFLDKHPEIANKILEFCKFAEADKDKPKLADDAEDLLVEDLRKFGVKLFECWAECRADEESQAIEMTQRVHKHGKKK